LFTLTRTAVVEQALNFHNAVARLLWKSEPWHIPVAATI
jgi:hypothetical protein